jgi:hypothetical protein
MNKIKEFFNEYGKIVSKILINHIAMTVFGIIVLISTSKSKALFHASGVLAILMYMFLLYMIMWELGAQNKVRVEAGRIKNDKLLGLKISLVANSAFILISLVEMVLWFFATPDAVTGVNNACGILKIIMNYIYGMYLSISSLAPNFGAMHLLLAIPSILCCTFSYLAGLSGMKCIFPDKKDNKKK